MGTSGEPVDASADEEPKNYIKLIFEILSGSSSLGGGNTIFSYNNMSVSQILYDTFLNMQNDNSIFINTSENSVFAYENMSIAQIMYDSFIDSSTRTSIFVDASATSVFAYENMSIAQIMYDTFFNL
jgi:hypothetical protein